MRVIRQQRAHQRKQHEHRRMRWPTPSPKRRQRRRVWRPTATWRQQSTQPSYAGKLSLIEGEREKGKQTSPVLPSPPPPPIIAGKRAFLCCCKHFPREIVSNFQLLDNTLHITETHTHSKRDSFTFCYNITIGQRLMFSFCGTDGEG